MICMSPNFLQAICRFHATMCIRTVKNTWVLHMCSYTHKHSWLSQSYLDQSSTSEKSLEFHESYQLPHPTLPWSPNPALFAQSCPVHPILPVLLITNSSRCLQITFLVMNYGAIIQIWWLIDWLPILWLLYCSEAVERTSHILFWWCNFLTTLRTSYGENVVCT